MNIISFCSVALTKPAVTRQQCKGTPHRHISGRLGSPQVRAAPPKHQNLARPTPSLPQQGAHQTFPAVPRPPSSGGYSWQPLASARPIDLPFSYPSLWLNPLSAMLRFGVSCPYTYPYLKFLHLSLTQGKQLATSEFPWLCSQALDAHPCCLKPERLTKPQTQERAKSSNQPHQQAKPPTPETMQNADSNAQPV